ncbi:MAG: glucose-1-phosphate cytidylyltransferase [Candidatus Melainabacteria bacterium]|nr:glucose-1-phosphate cytidylyltransferase [Candidatus Melainabacteria bacterium]
MKVAILAGGLGTRLQEETTVRPKALVEIGGRPILWHLMKFYSSFGFKEFVLALGYKSELIKEYFLNYHHHASNLTINLQRGEVIVRDHNSEDWTVHLLDTGLSTETGGRVKRLGNFIGNEPFLLTYTDGLSNVNIHEIIKFHKSHGRLATITAVRPPARFGKISFDGDKVSLFEEKPNSGEGWINGGFFVLEPGIVDYIEGDHSIFEKEPLEKLALDSELKAYRHNDFWQCMDVRREMQLLETLWQSGQAPWRVWDHVESRV